MDGSVSTGWLKRMPKVRWLSVDGRMWTGWSKSAPKTRCVSVDGRGLTSCYFNFSASKRMEEERGRSVPGC